MNKIPLCTSWPSICVNLLYALLFIQLAKYFYTFCKSVPNFGKLFKLTISNVCNCCTAN